MLLGVEPGDEVICPSFTFVSTVNAFVLRGARPVFCDIRPDTLNIDERRIRDLVTPRTRAVVPVHYAGVGCEMDAITSLCDERGVALVEDNALGLFGKYKDRYLGTFGSLSTLSFHETKSFSCGEGGALLINAPELATRAEVIREKGTNRARFFRGEVDKYSWVDIGSSYLPSDILAAFLLAQLEARAEVLRRRSTIWHTYDNALRGWASRSGVQLPTVPDECQQAYAMFYMLMPSEQHRQQLIKELRALGILSVFHYLPLHLSPMGKRMGYRPGQLPVTEDVSPRLIRLPFYNDLQQHEQEDVISAIIHCDLG
jgi:dTDP-4-amino-4,6-dideoxygalactose transaminase